MEEKNKKEKEILKKLIKNIKFQKYPSFTVHPTDEQ